MKKLMLVAAMVLGLAGMSFAQTGSIKNGTLSIGTTVLPGLTVSDKHDLALGSVVQGQTKDVSPTTAAGGGVQVGEFLVNGDPSHNVIFTFSADANLVSGANTILFTQDVPVWNTTESQSGTTAFAGTGGGTVALYSDGNLYIFVGGSVTASATQQAGTYSGTYTLQVQYQ